VKNILEDNLKPVFQYNSELAEKIHKCSTFENSYEINEGKSGDAVLYKNAIPVDDPIDPVWKAIEITSKIEFNEITSIAVIYGMGLGYIFKEVAKRYKGKIIIYEPDIEILRLSLEFVDFSQELNSSNIMITNSLEEIKAAYKFLFFKDYKFNFLVSDYYKKQDLATYAEFERKINNNHALYQQNYENLWKKNSMWSNLLFKNVPHIVKNPDAHLLKGKFENKTAIILSAGPSLDKNIDEIKAHREKVIVFCVGVAFRTAVKHGIIPDFVAVIDNRASIIDIPELEKVNLILTTNTYESIYKLKPKRFFNHHNKTTPACSWLAEILEVPNLEDYEAAGTVAINCLYMAKLMGCKKIILVGQDLAYSDNKCYSQSTIYSGFSVDDSKNINAKNTAEEYKNRSEFLNKDLIKIKGTKGEDLLTRPDYLTFIIYFEEIAANFGKELDFINATEGGAFLKGFNHISLKQALEDLPQDLIDVEQILQMIDFSQRDVEKRTKKLIKEYKFMIKNYEEVKSVLVENTYKKAVASNIGANYRKASNFYIENNILENSFKYLEFPKEITSEEREISAKYMAFYNENSNVLKNNICNLLKTNPQQFAKELKILKESYYKLKEMTETNHYFKIIYLLSFLTFNNKIKDFENNDENLVDLSFRLNRFFANLYLLGDIWFNKRVLETLKILENSLKIKV